MEIFFFSDYIFYSRKYKGNILAQDIKLQFEYSSFLRHLESLQN